jgi:hypothetical protein
MKYEYSIHGPFEIRTYKGVKNNKAVNRAIEAKKSFWDEVETKVPDLPTACGCYLFAIQAGKGFTPWYVGLAEKGFQKECLTGHKFGIYTDVLNSGSGTPILFFIARLTNKKNIFAKPSKNGRNDIKFLENMLIGTAIVKNSELKNKKQTKYLRNMRVPGVINTPKRKQFNSERDFKLAIKG